MRSDVKEVIGALMGVMAGGEISREEVEDLAFEAADELQVALNEAYIELLEFAYDRAVRQNDRRLDAEKRAALRARLDEIVRVSDRAASSN
jgi:hypothetical protein